MIRHIHVLKGQFYTIMSLKFGGKLRTANLNLNFAGSYKIIMYLTRFKCYLLVHLIKWYVLFCCNSLYIGLELMWMGGKW